jgi:glycosyltransferase involved in cell wall biosynthesis
MPALSNPISVIFIIGHYPGYGGVEKVTTDLAYSFSENDYNVSICSFFGDILSDNSAELYSKSVNHYRLSFPIMSPSNFLRLHKLIKTKRSPIIINQWCLPLNLSLLLAAVKLSTGASLVSCHHNNPLTNAKIISFSDCSNNTSSLKKTYYLLKLKIAKLLTKLSLQFSILISDKFILLSDAFIPLLKDFLGIRYQAKIISIPNPVSIPKEFTASNLELTSKENIITYVGRIDSNQKRVERVIWLWEDIQPTLPSWSLYIIGDGPSRPELEDYVLKHSLKNVDFLGFSNPHVYLLRSKINLLLSEWEGFGLVNVEAMIHGCVPVCLNSYAAAEDLICHGYNGILLAHPYNRNTTATEVLKLATNEQLLETIAVNSRKIASKYKIESISELWHELFLSLLLDK